MISYSRSAIYGALALGFILVALTLRHAPSEAHISMDSLNYFAGANNVLNGNGYSVQNFKDFSTLDPITLWPPLYSLTLVTACAISKCDTMEMTGKALFLNVIFSFSCVFLLYLICVDLSGSKMIATLCGLTFIMFSGYQIINVYAWSESLFILILIAFLRVLYYFSRVGTLPLLIALSILAALAFLTRYVGLVMIAILPICVLAQSKGAKSISLNLVSSGMVVVLIVTPLLLRNYIYSDTFFGYGRGAGDSAVVEDALIFSRILSFELFGGSGIVAALFLGASIVWLYIFPLPKSRYICYVSFLTFLYFVFLLTSRQLQSVELDQRMIVPMLPLFIILIAAAMTQTQEFKVPKWRKYVRVAPLGILFIGAAYGGLKTDKVITQNSRLYGEIRELAGIYYPNINSPVFGVIAEAISSLKLDKEYEIVTDFRRPLVVKYHDPNSSPVKKLTNESTLGRAAERYRVWLLFTNKGDGIYKSASDMGFWRAEVQSKNIVFKIVLELPRTDH